MMIKKIHTLLTLCLMLCAAVPATAQTAATGKQVKTAVTTSKSAPKPADGKKHGDRPGGVKGLKRPDFQQFVQDKMRFILREMKLSAADSARFAPVYQQLQLEKAGLMRANMEVARQARKTYRDVPQEQWPDSVKLAIVRAEYRLGVEDATLELHYLGRFEQILTPTQLMAYSRAEKRFRQSFMNGPGRPRPHDGKETEQPAPRR
jgi:Spy/CpxP family protein refolding chaperone